MLSRFPLEDIVGVEGRTVTVNLERGGSTTYIRTEGASASRIDYPWSPLSNSLLPPSLGFVWGKHWLMFGEGYSSRSEQ